VRIDVAEHAFNVNELIGEEQDFCDAHVSALPVFASRSAIPRAHTAIPKKHF
jgi:hypothetical protein